MMDVPLLIGSLIQHAARWHGDTEIVSRTVEGPLHRYGYAAAYERIGRLANALLALGAAPGDRVATLAWNTYRHFELYYAVPGIGAICHTVNPRLFPEQIAYIINHAADRLLFVDLTFVPLIEQLAAQLPSIEHYIILTGEATMPQTSLPGALCYETLVRAAAAGIVWPEFDERQASSLAYTSGTTGSPKGALYAHRSTVLHAFSTSLEGSYLNDDACVLPIVPMFHVNAWGLPYDAPLCGAKLVLNGAKFDPASLYELIEGEGVTLTGGVPTVWIAMLEYLRQTGKRFSTLRALRIGGSAAPLPVIRAYEEDYGVHMIHGWGMTESSPVCTHGTPKQKHLQPELRYQYQTKAGRCVYGVQMRIVDDAGRIQPDDGSSQGELQIRGPWVASAYYNDPEASAQAFTADGWFRTGDVATLDHDGYLAIVDRSKDVIKSGGEWISSIDLENVVLGHPDIAEAAVIGIAHPKWGERPMLLVRPKDGKAPSAAAIRAYLEGKIAGWWMPDEIVFVEALPYTATGKISKRLLRERFKDRALPLGSP